MVVKGEEKYHGFIFSLLNPPVPLGGNIVSLDIYVDNFPIPKKSIFVATAEDMVNAAILSESRPIPFKPFQSARFLVIKEGGLDEKQKHKIVIMSKMEGFEQIMIPFTFTDYARYQSERIFIPDELVSGPTSAASSSSSSFSSLFFSTGGEETFGTTIFKNFTAPLVLSGKKAYVVCSSNGSLSANWTWMGVRYDNGGLYVPPARAFGRIIVEISVDDGVRKRLPNFVVSSRHENGVLRTRHELAGLEVKRKLAVPFENRGFVMVLELSLLDGFGRLKAGNSVSNMPRKKKNTREEKPTKRSIRLHFLIDGNITSYGLAAISQSVVSKFNNKANCLQVSTATPNRRARDTGSTSNDVQYFGTIGVAPKNLKPTRILTDSFDNDLELSYDVELETGKSMELALVGTGSFSSADSCLKEYLYMRDNYRQLMSDTENGFKEFSSSTLTIRSSSSYATASTTAANTVASPVTTATIRPQRQNPTISKLIAAYEKAKTCMRYLKAEYDGLGEGICAGLPRFPNYWARDTGWAIRGYLAIGDYRFAVAAIDNFLCHQAKKTTKNATKGELPMIISGKAFLHTTTFGSADSTFLFPWAIHEYVLATGDIAYLKKRWSSIVDLVNLGFLKDVDGDGLVEHGFTGTAEKLPIQDSTWMDHIDRRKSANDIQALFYESLSVGSKLAAIIGDNDNEKRWRAKAQQLRERIDLEYWDEKMGFYYDTIRKDNSKDASIRPNALVLLLTNAVEDKRKAESVLARIEKEDMTTDWGVRTLSSQDPKYHPTLYHDGAVWPLVTGWAALSEVKFGKSEQAISYIESMADRILSENGMFAETYRGDRPEPFNSCILQAWSVAMYIHALREMMLGMKMNMIENMIQFEPRIPESLRDSSTPMTFEHPICVNCDRKNNNSSSGGNNANNMARLQINLDPYHEKISVAIKGTGSISKKPEIFSSSYSATSVY